MPGSSLEGENTAKLPGATAAKFSRASDCFTGQNSQDLTRGGQKKN